MAKSDSLNHDAVSKMLFDQIVSGIEAISKANETLLAEEEAGTGVRDIDKALKEDKHENKKVSEAWAAAEELRKSFRKALDDARNAYRVEVLKEEAKEESGDTDTLKEEAKEQRKIVLNAVELIKSYAGANGKKDVVTWAENLSIPQVGRHGTSVVGQKKPRAHVAVNGTVHDSFGEAAKAASVLLSTEDNKVTVTSGDLVSAWSENGEAETFDFQGLAVKVTLKNKDAAPKAA